jgi:hypothetical protein
MPLKQLVANLKTLDDGDQLIDYIFAEVALSEDQYLVKYFDASIRRALFAGGACSGRHVKLSPAAEVLKSALQRRYARNQADHHFHPNESFVPMTAYHGTTNSRIANLIVSGGFNLAGQTVRGKGAYFYRAPLHQRAEGYAISNGEDPEGMVLEVTIFAATTNKIDKPRRDKLVHTSGPDILVAKNPLLIFPKAVFIPGEKMLNSSGMKEWQSYAGPQFQRRLV